MTFAGTGVAQCARHCGQCFKAYPLVLRAGPLGSSKEFVSVQVVLLGHGSEPGWHPEDAGLPPETEPLQRSELQWALHG